MSARQDRANDLTVPDWGRIETRKNASKDWKVKREAVVMRGGEAPWRGNERRGFTPLPRVP
jgi:hypothetical protein